MEIHIGRKGRPTHSKTEVRLTSARRISQLLWLMAFRQRRLPKCCSESRKGSPRLNALPATMLQVVLMSRALFRCIASANAISVHRTQDFAFVVAADGIDRRRKRGGRYEGLEGNHGRSVRAG
jgi:hypothetical protein